MNANLFYSIVVLFLFINKTVSQCICTENKRQVRCIYITTGQNQEMEQITTINMDDDRILPPNALPLRNIQGLKLLCDIQSLQTKSFGNQNNLEELDLAQNFITTIPNDLFEPMPLLKKLNLSYNMLQSPTLDTFYALNNIKILDASHNEIANLELGVFDEMSKIEQLYLNDNKIATIELGVFDDLKHLSVLDLSKNNMRKIILGLFDQNKKLLKVNLAGNRFSGKVPLGSYDSLTKVTDLNLAHCKINKFPLGIFDETISLEKLDLSGNYIQELDSGIFDNLADLVDLNLSNCKLRSLPAHIFDQNSNLTRLDLSSNQLTFPNDFLFERNEALKYLNISRNLIMELPINIFHSTNLTIIDLSYNMLTTIEPDLLNIHALEEVHAQNNRISYLAETTFAIKKCPLKYLDLRNNRLVFISLIFFNWVEGLQRLEIFGNPWDCKCLEDLLPVLNNKKIKYTTGDYFQGKLPICVLGNADKCNIDKKNVSHYYEIYDL